MRALSANDLLIAAERLPAEPLARRGAALLAIALQVPAADAMELTIGERDARLLALRAATFGRQLTAVADCPSCNERCEIEVDVNALGGSAEEAAIVEVEAGAWRVRARLPTGADVAAAMSADPIAARRALFARCLVDVAGDDSEFPEEVAEAVETAMERADPNANISFAITCPACAASWERGLDIATFFAAEIRAASERLADDVHQLAFAYGWSEADILAMTPWRRQLYLDRVGR